MPSVLQSNIQLQQSFPKPLSIFWCLQLKKKLVHRQEFPLCSCSLACYRTYLLSPRACTSSRLWQMSSHLAWQPQYFHMQWLELFSKSTNTVANSKDWLNQLQNKTTKTKDQFGMAKLTSLTSSSYTPIQICEGNLSMAFISRQMYNNFAAFLTGR